MPACGQEDVVIVRPSMFFIKPLCDAQAESLKGTAECCFGAAGVSVHTRRRRWIRSPHGYKHLEEENQADDLVGHPAAVFLCSSFLVLDADFHCRLLAFQSVPIG